MTCSIHKVVKNKVKLTKFIRKYNGKQMSQKLQSSKVFIEFWSHRYEFIFIIGCFMTSIRILTNPSIYVYFINHTFAHNISDAIFKQPILFGSAFFIIGVLKSVGILFHKLLLRQIANILSISFWSMWGATFLLATPSNTVSALSAIMVMFSLVFLVQEGSDKI